jgi:hypothetical protein
MDLQCGEQPLKLSFLELFITACCKNMVWGGFSEMYELVGRLF